MSLLVSPTEKPKKIELIDTELQNIILETQEEQKKSLEWSDIALISIIAEKYYLSVSSKYVTKNLIRPKELTETQFKDLLKNKSFSTFIKILKR
ncbi:hypothetical protein ROZALSC1DRAFT_30005, partial [Rozella allomycis CSF55]